MLTTINPTTGTVIKETSPLSDEHLQSAIRDSQQAFDVWKQYNFAERKKVLLQAAEYMDNNLEELALLMTVEMGKPVKEARGEVNKAASCARHYAHHAENYLASESIQSDAEHSYVQYLPLGVLLGILPWNAPFWLAFRFCAPALMAGNTCLIKHDPHVQGCAKAIAHIFEHTDAPANLLQNLSLENQQIEQAIRHPLVQAVSFTGSSRAGAIVASTAASEIKHSVLELGGSDPCIILADADLEKAAQLVSLSRIINAGQSCIAAKRIIVEAPVYDEFIVLLQAQLENLKMGDPREEDTDIGPIARDDLRAELHRQVEETIEAGARCLLGGKMPQGNGFFYPVTLLVDVTNEMTACREETFGPVAVVLKADNERHALEIANDSDYGLAGSIWTKPDRGEQLAGKLETGQVAINGLVKTDPRLPSGGIKRSGFGRELGPHGIHEFVNTQQVWIGK